MYRISVGTSWVPQQRRLCLYSIEQKLGLYPGGGAAHSAAHPQLVSRMMTMTSYSGDEGRGARRPPMLVPLRRHPSLPVSEPKRNPLTGFWQHLLVFVFGPRDDMSDVVVEPAASPDDDDDHRLGRRAQLSPILVAPARLPDDIDFVVTAPTPPTSGSSSSSAARTPNEMQSTSGFDTSTTLRSSTPNGTAGRRAPGLRPSSVPERGHQGQQYLSPGRPAQRQQRAGRNKTISDVTAEARKVLEQLILRNDPDALQGLAALAAGSAAGPFPEGTVLRTSRGNHPGVATSTPVPVDVDCIDGGNDEPDGKARPGGVGEGRHLAPSSLPIRDSVAMPEDDATSHSPVSGPNSTYSFSSRSSSHRNRIHLMTQITDEAQLKKAAAQQRNRKKKKRKTRRLARQNSTSSSSSSEYEIVDGQLRLRSKKSLFKRAKERLRQSFRRKKPPHLGGGGGHSFDPYSIDDDEIREAQQQKPAPARETKRSFRLGFLPQRSDKSRSSTDRSPVADRDFLSDVPSGATSHHYHQPHPRCPVHNPDGVLLHQARVENGSAVQPRDAAPPGEKEKTNRSIFDSILRTIRRGSGKLRRKGSTKETTNGPQRSRSADAITFNTVQRRDETLNGQQDPSTAYAPHRKSAKLLPAEAHRRRPQEETSTSLRPAAAYCRCHSADGAQVAQRLRPPPPPPLPALLPPSDAADDEVDIVHLAGRRRPSMVDGFESYLPVVQGGQDVPRGRYALYREDGVDEVDSKSPPLPVDGPVVPFAQKTDQEKDELYEKIAEQLAAIADNYNLESPRSMKNSDLFFKAPAPTETLKPVTKSASAPVTTAPALEDGAAAAPVRPSVRTSLTVPLLLSPDAAVGAAGAEGLPHSPGARGGRTPIEQKIGRILRDKGDRAAGDLSDFQPVVTELVRNASYSQFQQIIHENVGSEPGWQQVALVFNLTRSAVQLAGLGTAAALQIKELTLRYFEDRFAGWIIGQGGWESMVEDTDLSSEVD